MSSKIHFETEKPQCDILYDIEVVKMPEGMDISEI